MFLDIGNVFQRSIEFSKSQVDDVAAIFERNFEYNVPEIDKRTRIVTNYCEAAVCLNIIQALIQVCFQLNDKNYFKKNFVMYLILQAGVKGTSIGIISPYRAQVELLKQLFIKYESSISEIIPHGCGIEVNTVDQYQGRDKDIIIYSCTKCDNPSKLQLIEKKNIEILEDQRRLTVAITRSKHKLIMIGDVESLQIYTPFQGLFQSLTGMCKIKLSDGTLGFTWNTLLSNLALLLKK